MPLPVQSVRAKPEHRDVLRAVADLLRDGREEEVRSALAAIGEPPLGPFRDRHAALAFLRDRLVAALRPEEIWLFGSRARGSERAESDFDLLVVLPDGLDEKAYAWSTVSEPVAASGLAVDIVPCPRSDFERDLDRPGSLIHAAISEGRRIYDRARTHGKHRSAR